MKVPYYSDEQLWQRASIERERTWDETLPVDIELIVEEQGIEVIPLPGLRKNASIDACMSRDTNTIYIDHEYVEDPRMLFRVRFSVAHEYAHRILHKEVFEQDDMSLDRVSDDAVRKYLANPIHRAFEVSTKVVEIRLRKYGLYPLH